MNYTKAIYVVLKNDSSKMIKDMDIIAMSYNFMDLQGVDGILTVIFEEYES